MHRLSLPLAGAALLLAVPALAHVVAGNRVFPVTLTLDDPGVADEASLPSFGYTRSGAANGNGPSKDFQFGFEYDKTITPDTAIILNDGVNATYTKGAKTQTGFQDLVVTGKWQALLVPEHELVGSVGIIRELGSTGTVHSGADRYGSTSPAIYAGKGLGDLPIGYARPFAVTGELYYTIADVKLKSVAQPTMAAPVGAMTPSGSAAISSQFNAGANNAWFGGFSLQYSLPYLQSQVHDFGLPDFVNNLIPIVEFNWSAPSGSPSSGGTTWTAAPGVIYLAEWGEIGAEALIPLNKQAGRNVGAVALVHFFFDDLFPNTIGKPIFN